MRLAINLGHTLHGTGSGAVSKINGKTIRETDRNREVGNKLINKLKNYNVEVINCTIDKSNDDMYEACKKANNSKADMFISIHLNIGGGHGVETFYNVNADKKNIEFANKLNNYLAKTKSLQVSRRCMSDMSYYKYQLYVLKNTNMSAVLTEVGFIDNKTDVENFNAEEIAEAMLKAIVEFYNLKKKDGSSINKPNPKPPSKPQPPKPQAPKKLWEVSISGQIVKDLQSELNKQCNAKLKIDGWFGEDTLNKCIVVRKTARGNITRIIQRRLNDLKYSTGGIDGIFGTGTYNAVVKFQKDRKLVQDGIVGRNTWKELFKK